MAIPCALLVVVASRLVKWRTPVRLFAMVLFSIATFFIIPGLGWSVAPGIHAMWVTVGCRRKIGFAFGEPWEGFYAIGQLDGLELHLKEAPRNQAERRHRRHNEHLDAAAGVDGFEAFYEQCVAGGATILRPLTATAWGTKAFYVEDPDGHIVCFGGRPTARRA